MSKMIEYKIVGGDKQYIQVECPVLNENIVIHPGVRDAGTIKDGMFIVSAEDDYVKRNIHAIRCNCSVCTGHKSNLVSAIKDNDNVKVFNLNTGKYVNLDDLV